MAEYEKQFNTNIGRYIRVYTVNMSVVEFDLLSIQCLAGKTGIKVFLLGVKFSSSPVPGAYAYRCHCPSSVAHHPSCVQRN